MKEFLHRIRLITSIWAILLIALGVLLVMRPGEVMIVICRLCGLLFVITGAFMIISSSIRRLSQENGYAGYPFYVIFGGVLLAAGLFIVWQSKAFIEFVAILLAIILLINAVNDIIEMRTLRLFGFVGWYICLVNFVAKFVFAVLLIMRPFDSQSALYVVAGIGLIYAGISALFVNFNIVRGYRSFTKASNEAAREADLRKGIIDGTLVDEETIDFDDKN